MSYEEEILDAAVCNNLKLIQNIIKTYKKRIIHGPNPEPDLKSANNGYTAEHWAAFHNNPEILNILLQYRNPNANFSKDAEGLTPMELACKLKRWGCLILYIGIESIDNLINKFPLSGLGTRLSSIQRVNDGYNLLHIAIEMERVDLVTLLLKYNPDLTKSNKLGETPLQFLVAIQHGLHKDKVEKLFELFHYQPNAITYKQRSHYESTMEEKLIASVKLSLDKLKERYAEKIETKNWCETMLAEIAQHIEQVKKNKLISKRYYDIIMESFARAKTELPVTTEEYETTLKEALALVWIGINDHTTIIDAKNAEIIKSTIHHRRLALCVTLYKAQTGKKDKAGKDEKKCPTGFMNDIVCILKDNHKDVIFNYDENTVRHDAILQIPGAIRRQFHELLYHEDKKLAYAQLWGSPNPDDRLIQFRKKVIIGITREYKKVYGHLISAENLALMTQRLNEYEFSELSHLFNPGADPWLQLLYQQPLAETRKDPNMNSKFYCCFLRERFVAFIKQATEEIGPDGKKIAKEICCRYSLQHEVSFRRRYGSFIEDEGMLKGFLAIGQLYTQLKQMNTGGSLQQALLKKILAALKVFIRVINDLLKEAEQKINAVTSMKNESGILKKSVIEDTNKKTKLFIWQSCEEIEKQIMIPAWHSKTLEMIALAKQSMEQLEPELKRAYC
ncbi:MAG: ankyrin repeat domain-containing protein [Gammaproteobacteria bacterium]